MKLKGISDEGLKRVAQARQGYEYPQHDPYDLVNEALTNLARIDEELLSDAGIKLLNAAYGSVQALQQGLGDALAQGLS